ncbi:MAG: hypothetical protein AB1750_16120 [Chloroflexota bacterium]
MNTHPVMVNLPQRLYGRVQKRAQLTARSVESELLDAVARAMQADDDLPEELSAMLEDLSLLDDKSLRRAARTKMKASESAQMEKLHLKRQQVGLNASEAQALANLVRQYEKIMLVRAQSAALLKQRGHDISELLATA